MGCNTSKENVQGAADEAKEDANNGNIPKAESIKGKVNILRVETKSTVLHRTRKNGDAANEKEEDDASPKIEKEDPDENKKLEEDQVEGKEGRDSPNTDQTTGQNQQAEACETKEAPDSKEDQGSSNTMSKCEQAVPLIKMVEAALADSSPDAENKVDSTQDAHGYDMTDPNLHSAASKIQSHFRRSQDRQKWKASQNEKTQ